MNRHSLTGIVVWLAIVMVCAHAEQVSATEVPISSQPDFMDDADPVDPDGSTLAAQSRFVPIFISFPDLPPETGYPNSVEIDSLAYGLANSLTNQSGGRVNLVPQIVTDPATGSVWWTADFPMANYMSDSAVQNIPGGPRYGAHYSGEAEVDHMGELQAEILWKIYNAYLSASLPNPFEGASLVAFMYAGNVMVFPTHPIVGGYGRTSVYYDTFTFLDDEISLDNLAPYYYANVRTLPGCQLEIQPSRNNEGELWRDRWELSHEMGHYILPMNGHLTSLRDCPEDSATGRHSWQLTPSDYKYGPYAQMRRTSSNNSGIVPFHLRKLIEKGWVTANEVANDQESIVLGDLRIGKEALRVPVPGGGSGQYFLLSYHGGNGMDNNLGMAGQPIYRSRGLSVWHIYYGVSDLESAWGRFGDPDSTGFSPSAWTLEDPESGFDNHDVFFDLCGLDHTLVDYGPAYRYTDNYPGSEEDFFGSQSNKFEFSYRSNPNTFGQSGYSWRAPQDLPNSLSIEILEESTEWVRLRILFAPREKVQYPDGGEALLVGQSYDVSWTKEYTIDQPGGIVDTVDIFFSPGAGLTDVLIASGVDATAGIYSWTPGPEHVSDTAKIKVVYHNVNDASHTGTDESDDYFVVVAPPVAKFTNVSTGTQLNYSGQPTCAIGYDVGTDEFKDLFVGVEAGGAQSYAFQQTLLGSGGVPEFAFNSLFFPQAGARAVVTGDYDNDGDLDLLVTAAGGVEVYRKDSGGTYTEVSSDLGLALLTDKATAAVWGDYDNDGWLDLYVVRTGGYTDPPTFPNVFGEQHRLFRNKIAFGGNPPFGEGFVDVTNDAGLTGIAAVGSVSASFIDYDRDGDLDLFVANLQPPPAGGGGMHSLLFINQGDGTFVEEYESRFSGAIYYATAHKWSDVDNDGDFDLVLTTHEYKPEIHFNDGFGGFAFDPVMRLDADEGHAGLEVFDQDLDGWSDIFCVSQDVLYSNRFFTGVGTVAGVDYVETTGSVGMSSASDALGSAVADFTRDGDLDLFLGKPVPSGEYFYITDNQSGGEWIGRDYAKVRLESPYGANNRAGLGAVIEVTDGTRTWVRSVDGGSGRGGQDDRDLIFGLGQATGALTATVWWPDGHYLAGIPLTKSNEALGETLNLITDDLPALVNIDATSVINPVTGTLDWTFSWDSHFASDPAQDVLAFDQAGIPVPCWPGWPDLTPTTPGVTHSYYQLPNGKFHHQFDVPNVDCVKKCSFRFTVSSFISGTTLTSAPQTKSVKFCPAQF